jgi:hypothetical protein
MRRFIATRCPNGDMLFHCMCRRIAQSTCSVSDGWSDIPDDAGGDVRRLRLRGGWARIVPVLAGASSDLGPGWTPSAATSSHA